MTLQQLDLFESLHPGRRMIFGFSAHNFDVELPGEALALDLLRISPSSWKELPDVIVTILDAPAERELQYQCAALIVPQGSENEWIYMSEGGQWQVLADGAFGRLIIVNSRPELRCNNVLTSERELRPRVLRFAQKECRECPLSLPFITYADDISRRVVVEELDSPGCGRLLVEDVAYEHSDEGLQVFHSKGAEAAVGASNSKSPPLASVPAVGEVFAQARMDSHRPLPKRFSRRLRFWCMPNLVQSEVRIVPSVTSIADKLVAVGKGQEVPEYLAAEQSTETSSLSIKEEATQASSLHGNAHPEAESLLGCSSYWQVDYTILVHKYLPHILAGFVLVSSALQAMLDSGLKPRVLVLGGGAFTLPIFLQHHFPFHIEVVEIDEVVVGVARRHFELKEDEDMRVHVRDAQDFLLQFTQRGNPEGESPANCFGKNIPAVEEPAQYNVNVSPKPDGLAKNRNKCSRLEEIDELFHIVVLDINASDGRATLSSPPAVYLEHELLNAVRLTLQSNGMLAINLMPWTAQAYQNVVANLRQHFSEVYRLPLEDDVNVVFFALPSTCSVNMHSAFVDRLQAVISPDLLHNICKV
eukprot:jgi/Mesen1/9112/ME000058S08599